MFLSSGKNKNALIKFLVTQWTETNLINTIKDKELYLTNGNEVIKVVNGICYQQVQLYSNHEEADTRILLHVADASQSYSKCVVASPDTDVFVIMLSVNQYIDAELYFLTGTQSKKRMISISSVAEYIDTDLNPKSIHRHLLLRSLIGIHSFTGCDTVSSFAGKGKVKPFNLMVRYIEYIEAFANLGSTEVISNDYLQIFEEFVCQLYGTQNATSINDLRYQMYCQSNGKIACEMLPPCQNVLHLHCKRANYQAYVWRNCLQAQHEFPNLKYHGWATNEDNELEIEWMSCNPAPDEVTL